MPHCILEYSNNLKENPDNFILIQINQTLFDNGLFELNDIKSRMVVHHKYLIGDGDIERAFVTLSVEILGGRDSSTKKMITEKCLKVLENYFTKSLKSLKLSITVQIRDIDKPSYARSKSY